MRALASVLLAMILTAQVTGADAVHDYWKDLPVYGTKSDATVAIKIHGDGVDKPGTYHVKSDITLLDFAKLVGRSRLSNGRFTVSRTEGGYERSYGFRFARKEPPLPEFRLRDGDFIYAAINLP